ncbi:hypothetical protein ACE1B6_12035 [Aerosakkonemataceae cyanobacterium BLCC-F154]|uniref:Uncharacterized protein n=1 Tax=Floridaenema fluviatile BLCC-F154 TaxID=3153640 RepID=A0ABV4YAY2_9CYAN
MSKQNIVPELSILAENLESIAKQAKALKEEVEQFYRIPNAEETDEEQIKLLKFLRGKAIGIAKSQNKHTPRHVNQMTNSELQEWISQNS